ncbi:CueP family metal-binding protein [Thaumasiovibrio sp. DFM-14]|uniref:CueP family metal-binding protein n=1 Tax=Thaumasiovibrio sp. DFM-14 TaxID=3384792 RepID=UPI0039A1AB76
MNKINKALVMAALISTFNAAAMTAEAFSKLTPQQALEQSHQWHRTGEASVKVLPQSLEATLPSGEQVSMPLGDQFLLSIAPFVHQTHACTYHVPTGCQGEMVEETMHLTIKDAISGEILKDEQVTTQKDGFLDVWVPRGGEYQFDIRQGGLTASEILSSEGNSRTCITTMQLTAL